MLRPAVDPRWRWRRPLRILTAIAAVIGLMQAQPCGRRIELLRERTIERYYPSPELCLDGEIWRRCAARHRAE